MRRFTAFLRLLPWVMGLISILPLTTWSAVPRTKDFSLKLDPKAENEFLGTVKVSEKRSAIRLLEDSYLFNLDYGNRQSLYAFITRLPSMYDAKVYQGVYNLNFRGINTTTTANRLPISVITDWLYSYDAYRTPRFVYLLPYIEHREGYLASNDLQIGAEGMVTLTSTIPRVKTSSDLTIRMDKQNQTVMTRSVGSFSPATLYGVNFSLSALPGRYANKPTYSNIIPTGTNLSSKKNFDKEQAVYLNAYIVNTPSSTSQSRYYINFSKDDRGYIQGEQVFYDDYTKKHTLKQINKDQASNLDSYAKNQTLVLGVDGSTYAGFPWVEGSYQHNYALSLESHKQDNLQDLDRGTRLIPSLGISGVKKDSYNNQTFNFTYRIEPDQTALDSHYRFGAHLYVDRKRAKDVENAINFQSNTHFPYAGDIRLNYNYTRDLIYLDLNGAARFFASPNSYFDLMLIGKVYQSHLLQESKAYMTGAGAQYWKALNSRLTNAGLSSFKKGGDKHDITYRELQLLPSLEWTVRQRLNELNRHLYFMRYYQSSQPGGINPYLIRGDKKGRGIYKPERYQTFQLGLDGIYNGGLIFLNMTLYYIDMKDLQYRASKDTLEPYFGNFKGAKSYGIDLRYRQRFLPNLEWMIQGSATKATYKTFIHKPFSNSSVLGDRVYDYTHNQVVNTPKFLLWTYMSYTSIGGWYLRAEYRHFGEFYTDYANLLKNKPYGIANLAIGWENDNTSVQLYVRNAADKDYTQAGLVNPYNYAGHGMAEICKAGACQPGATFVWKDTAIKSYGDPRAIGLLFSLHN